MVLQRVWRHLLERLQGGARRTSGRPRRCRPLLELLEDRTVPTNFFVSTLGVDVQGGGAPAAPFRSIQFAINRAQSGDRIHVATGTYGYNPTADELTSLLGVTAAVTVYDKSLQIFGGFDNSFQTLDPTANRTTIDGGGAVRGVFVLANAVDVNLDLEGFTIQAGVARGESRLRGDDATFAFGGGMWINAAARQNSGAPGSFTLRDVVFRGNQAVGNDVAGDAGGAGSGGGLALRGAPNVILERVEFDNNEARGGSGATRGGFGDGAGFQADHSAVNGTDLVFTNNRAVGGNALGGGATNVNGDVEQAHALGGAAAVQNGSLAMLHNVVALSNLAQGGNAGGTGGGGFGGAFFAEGNPTAPTTLNLLDANLRNNTAQGGTGQSGGVAGGGAVASHDALVNLDRVQAIANASVGGGGTTGGSPGGGGLYLTRFEGASSVSVNNSVIAANTVQFGAGSTAVGGGGGGIWLQGVAATITQVTVADNLLGPGLRGQAVLLLDDGAQAATTATIAYSILANHTSAAGGAALDVRQTPGSNFVVLNRVLFANNTKNDNADGKPDPAGGFPSPQTVLQAADAGFLNPALPAYDYGLRPSSPAIDAGAGSAAAVDIDQKPRTGVPDLGAYEALALPVPRDSAAAYDPNTGLWIIRNSNTTGTPNVATFLFGAGGRATPVAGDWDGNGTTTVGEVEVVPDPSNPGGPGLLLWKLRNSLSGGPADIPPFLYGMEGDVPVTGDWSGSGRTGIGIFDPTTATWQLRNRASGGAPDFPTFQFGAPGWKPVVGDWNGDGKQTVGVYDSVTATFHLRNSNSAGGADAGEFSFLGPDSKPVAGDWNSDGKQTIGVLDPDGTWLLRNENTAGGADAGFFRFGQGNWIPLAGHWEGRGLSGLRAADGSSGGTPAALDLSELQAFYAAALGVLMNAGVGGDVLARLGAARLQVSHLGDGLLGQAAPTENRIAIDADAAGHGWFIDPTPGQDEEFAGGRALAGGPAAGRMDLLTTVLHEMGHLTGLEDLDPARYPDQLMTGTLPVGVRRAAVAAFLAERDPQRGETRH